MVLSGTEILKTINILANAFDLTPLPVRHMLLLKSSTSARHNFINMLQAEVDRQRDREEREVIFADEE